MKKIVAGGFFLLSGILLYLGIRIPAGITAAKLGGWETPPGRYGTALEAIGGAGPANIAIVFIILGTVMIVLGAFSEELSALWKKVADKERELAE
ncbi:hypothetical protein [Paenibacillus ferrarius]|uniref:hypothetical protein n=1 Tax=Paenibacillus ferrarius TaxID=1469647 RepID=UPI003D2A2396